MSSLEFCSGQSGSGTPASVLPSSVSTVSVLEEAVPPTATTVPFEPSPGLFPRGGDRGPALGGRARALCDPDCGADVAGRALGVGGGLGTLRGRLAHVLVSFFFSFRTLTFLI